MPNATAADGATIAYESTGAGAPLVLVHGITESRRSWDPLVDELARDHHVIALDLRGHGESERRPPYDAMTMAADVDAVVRAAGARDPLVVGHSLGGAVVSIYAAGSAVRGVVNVDQPLRLDAFKELLTPVEPMLRGDAATFRSVIDQMMDGLYGPLAASERSRLAAHAHPEQDVVLGVWDLVLTTDVDELIAIVTSAAGSITAPYLSLHGSDPGSEYLTWLRETLPGATVEVWPDHGHYPHLVDTTRFLQRLRSFEQSL